MNIMCIPDEKRRICNDNALHCFGTAYIFEKRAAAIRKKLIWLTFLGIAVPASVGALIATFNLSPGKTKYLLFIAGFLGTFQLILSIWALASGWNDKLQYYLESKSSNYYLSKKFNSLGSTTTMSKDEFIKNLDILNIEEKIRTDSDHKQDISDSEKRMGMRSALRQYERPCSGCNIIPKSMKGSDCGICGK